MNKEIYLQLLSIAKEVFKYLKCTDKNRVLNAGEIAKSLQHRAEGARNKSTWAVYWSNEINNIPFQYTIKVNTFSCSFPFSAVFAYLAKFETLAGIPTKERQAFVFGDGSERKEKVSALYFDKKRGCAIAGTILLHLLNNKVAIKTDGSRARVFIRIPGALFEWYEVNTLEHYKKNYESNVIYLTGNYYNNMIKILRGWKSSISYTFDAIYLRASEQIEANEAAAIATTGSTGNDSSSSAPPPPMAPQTATVSQEPPPQLAALVPMARGAPLIYFYANS